MKRREFVILAATVVSAPALLASRAAHAASPIAATLYKNPSCTCCEGYARYLEKNGFKVTVKPTNDLAEISQKAGVPENLEGCHTMFVGGYVVDGHVPVDIIRKLLAEKPAIAGISLPGLPSGSPGMTGSKTETWTVYAVTKDGEPPKVFTTV
ncbi:MAG: CopG family transcriptional regulator [Beijerinckiaceae bacterium]|nr:MAG: CopG family transcriptional regulator [Beijerinckiaceae bacterium]